MTDSSQSLVVSADEYLQFRRHLETSSGILLGDGKEYLVVSRLRRLMAQRNLPNITELLYCMDRDRQLSSLVIDAMTTNETLWFRDSHPYKIFREKILPELAEKTGQIRVWSAACSTGQEPYSLKMEEAEFNRRFPGKLRSSMRILATDISTSALQTARQGAYPWLAIRRGMPEEYLERYFTREGEDSWRIRTELKSGIEYREFNLQSSYSSLGKFDVIFCRNVLIYFSNERKRDILIRMHELLPPGGYLFLGASEAMTQLGEYYEMIACHPGILYRAKAR